MGKCPHCATANPDEATFCRRCNGLLQPDQFFQTAPNDPSGTIRLGYQAQFFGQTYTVVGWLRYEMTEDDEVHAWDEWRLHNPQGGDLWLVREGDFHFKLLQPYAPQTPLAWSEVAQQSRLAVDGRVVIVTERGEATIVAAVGDVDVREGERVEYADGRGMDGTLYSFERDGEVAAIYKGKPISPLSVYEAFGLKAAAEALRSRLTKLLGLQRVGVALMLVGLLAWASILALPKGTLLTQRSFTVTLTPTEQVRAAEVPLGVFTLTPARQPYCLTVQTDVPTNSWLFCQLIAEDVAGAWEQEVPALAHEFWDEEGYEEGEYWHERDEQRNFHFQVKAAGSYALRLYLEGPTNLATAPITVRLYERAPAAAPLWWFGGIAVAVGFLAWFTGVGGWQWLAEHADEEE